jgi:hypothetical protein
MKRWEIIEHDTGDEITYLNGRVSSYKDFFPAIRCNDGTYMFFENGVLHREFGPAVLSKRGNEWWYRGSQYSLEEYNKIVKVVIKNLI